MIRAAFLGMAFALLSPVQAYAQDTFDAHGLVVVGFDDDVRDAVSVYRPGRFERGQWFVGVLGEYAKSPLRRVVDDGTDVVEQSVLDHVISLNTGFGLAVHDHVRLDVSAPLYLSAVGLKDEAVASSLGDISASAMISLIRPAVDDDGGGFGLGLAPILTVPSGRTSVYLGQKLASGGAVLAATYEFSRFTTTGNLGLRFNPGLELENLVGSDVLTSGLAVGYLFDAQTSVTAEIGVQTPFAASIESGSAAPAELLLSTHHRRKSGAHFTAGAAAAVSPGAGAATYRLVLGGGFGVRPTVEVEE